MCPYPSGELYPLLLQLFKAMSTPVKGRMLCEAFYTVAPDMQRGSVGRAYHTVEAMLGTSQ